MKTALSNGKSVDSLVPVSSANEASWRALLRAGFRLAAQGDLKPDNPADALRHEILRFERPVDR